MTRLIAMPTPKAYAHLSTLHTTQYLRLHPRADPCRSDWTCGTRCLCDATLFLFATRREL
jgi:hypothetical protein